VLPTPSSNGPLTKESLENKKFILVIFKDLSSISEDEFLPPRPDHSRK
jgi:hypothetical protein